MGATADLLTPGYIHLLADEDWGDLPREAGRSKGVAIDRRCKREFGGAGAEKAHYDLTHDVGNSTRQEVKSYSQAWIALSPQEFDLADSELLAGRDLPYLLYKQHTQINEFSFTALVLWSRLRERNYVIESKNTYQVAYGVWAQGYCFAVSNALKVAEPT